MRDIEINIGKIIGRKCKYLFVLESPHKDEIANLIENDQAIPAVGFSGTNLNLALHGINQPLGLAISSDEEKYVDYGIFNVSHFALQEIAYTDNDLEIHDPTIQAYIELRENARIQTNVLKNEKGIEGIIEGTENYINELRLAEAGNFNTISILNERLSQVLNEKEIQTIIVCGTVARCYIQLWMELYYEQSLTLGRNKDFGNKKLNVFALRHPREWYDDKERVLTDDVRKLKNFIKQ